jgi:hypothetical protein
MSKARAATDQIVKLIVGAGQASPSPPVGPALGSKGVKSMDFCKVCSSNLSSWEAIELHNIIPKPDLALKTIAKNFPGIQCSHSTYDTRNPNPSPRNRPT